MRSLEGRAAIVTGSARGIGRAIALELARQGASVVVNYLGSAQQAEEVCRAIEDDGGAALSVQADVRRLEDAQRLVSSAVERFGRLDILVNNAGITRDGLMARMSEDDWDAVLDTNLKGAFQCIKAAQRVFLRQRYGRIINIGSVIGLSGNAGQANYSAAKAGLVGLTKSAAKELGSRGITVNLVAPGFIATDMTAKLPEAVLAEALERIPLGHVGQCEDVARAVAFLSSDRAAYITGQVLCVDGGLSM